MIKREELSNPASCMSRAREDEMTFVLLGRDVAAPAAIRAWIGERLRLGKNKPDDPQIIEAMEVSVRMRYDQGPQWQKRPTCPGQWLRGWRDSDGLTNFRRVMVVPEDIHEAAYATFWFGPIPDPQFDTKS